MRKAKEAYDKYYQGLEAPIGGIERYVWINSRLLDATTHKTILDVGCGEGSLLKMLKDKGNDVFGIDASKEGFLACQKKEIDCKLLDASVERFPYNDDKFDIVLCLETIEHLENPYHCICEIKRVLKEKGTLIISIPNFKMLHPYIYPGLFKFKHFRDFLELNSFEIIQVKGWGQVAMLNRSSRWLKSKDNAFTQFLSKLIFYLSRKRNALMRNHLGTPLTYSHAWNFVCLNNKSDKNLLELVADKTCHSEARENG
jgi:SAM-dependent methyltransferase